MSAARIATGLDRLASGEASVVSLVRGRRVGLVCHPASVDRRLTHAIDVVREAGADLRALFGPEHGLGGTAQDMVGVEGERGVAGIPVHSLYGASEASLAPRPESLEGLDAIVVDLQDVGSRYYTFVWTAALVLRAAARAGVHTIVLDRPNPLGGDVVEGAPQRPGYRSFVGLYDVAVRHGLTIGELCVMVRLLEGLNPASLTVVAMRGWRRAMRFDDTGLPWVLPSPNMPTLDTARVYPGGCLLEGTTLSEGRGTTRPFEIVGAPWLDGARLAADVGPLEGAHLRPLRFEPTFHKHAKADCGGVQVHVTDEARFAPYAAYLRMLHAMRAQGGERFGWRADAYEFVKDRPAIDLLTGGPEARQVIARGGDLAALLEADAQGARGFAESRRAWLRYR